MYREKGKSILVFKRGRNPRHYMHGDVANYGSLLPPKGTRMIKAKVYKLLWVVAERKVEDSRFKSGEGREGGGLLASL